MPEQRLQRTRATLPSDYQFGDALGSEMRSLMAAYARCEFCGRGITLCSAFPCDLRAVWRATVRQWIKAAMEKHS